MQRFIVKGKKRLSGTVTVSGAKNVALKAVVAACLTDEEVIIQNVPHISDFFIMTEIITSLGGKVSHEDHTVRVKMQEFTSTTVSLEKAANIRASVMFMAPLLARKKQAIIPNPGGCRIGARPIERTIDGLIKMGVTIQYDRTDGYFHTHIPEGQELSGIEYEFAKNTHTGTETLLLAGVLAKGKTILKNCAQEPEVDELIALLNAMGASVKRISPRTIEVNGVEKLHGTTFSISPDRNEIVTLAMAAVLTGGNIFVSSAKGEVLKSFLEKLKEAGGGVEVTDTGIRFFAKDQLKAVDVTTSPAPGFMTDWQGPWAIGMTQANGESIVHETVYENRFEYVHQLRKMGAKILLFNPDVPDPKTFYNFNFSDGQGYFHAAKITGPVALHNGVVQITDLRAGATLVLAALCAQGETIIYGLEHLDRGYEQFEKRLAQLGADIRREQEE